MLTYVNKYQLMIKEINKSNIELSLLTLKQASELLGCHPNTLRQWDKNGLLQAVRFGARKDRRYRRDDILKLTGRTSYVENEKEVAKVSEIRKEYFEEYASLLVKWGRLNENSVFVDVPCGTGEMTRTIIQGGFGKKFYLIDINSEMVKVAQENISAISQNGVFKIGDAGDVSKLVPGKVDAIFCLNGFHIYIDRKQEFLKGCYKILKPGGILIFDVSTKGIHDKLSKNFLSTERKELQQLAKKVGAGFKFPDWPDENLLEQYRTLSVKNGFTVNETISIDKWMSIDEAINSTLKIPGRLRPWLPGISDEQRMAIYKQANRIAIKKTGIKMIKHNRVFFIAKKEV